MIVDNRSKHQLQTNGRFSSLLCHSDRKHVFHFPTRKSQSQLSRKAVLERVMLDPTDRVAVLMKDGRIQLLVINPNMSASVSATLHESVAAACGSAVDVRVQTARFGAPYIASESSFAVAEHATLDAWAAVVAMSAPLPDAVLVGCFGDPGLFALKECSAVPVTGLAVASLARVASEGHFAIVPGGHEWKPILTRFVHAMGFAKQLPVIETVKLSGAKLAQRPEESRTLVLDACTRITSKYKVCSVIIGGAALAGMAATLQLFVPVPLFDSVVEGAREAVRLVRPRATVEQLGRRFEWTGLSAEMQAMTLGFEEPVQSLPLAACDLRKKKNENGYSTGVNQC